MYLWADWNVCSEKLFDWDLCLRETDQLICNINELTNSYIVRAFTESYFQKNIVVCSWIPFCKKGSYRKETSQLICNTNSVGFCWKTLLHRLWLTSPSRMDFFFFVFFCFNMLHVSSKLCLNLCSRKWLRPSRDLISYLMPLGLRQLNRLLGDGLTNCSKEVELRI